MYEENNKTYTMNNIKVKIYKEVSRDVCGNFEDAEEFIKERTEEICARVKHIFGRRNSFFLFMNACVFNVMICC